VCGNPDDAQDLAQETFLHALQKIGSYRFAASFYTWLFRIAVNQALSHRRKSRRVTLSLHDGDGEWTNRPAGGQTPAEEEPLARLAARELQQRLLCGLDSLDDDYRAIIVLRDIESLDYQEIAEVLEISVGTVKSRLHRARMALREKVKATD
jgi:RNA polymerase sigma-70 factor (ECF subfamily)